MKYLIKFKLLMSRFTFQKLTYCSFDPHTFLCTANVEKDLLLSSLTSKIITIITKIMNLITETYFCIGNKRNYILQSITSSNSSDCDWKVFHSVAKRFFKLRKEAAVLDCKIVIFSGNTSCFITFLKKYVLKNTR